MCRDVYIPFFKINVSIFCCPLFFEEYFKPQVRINKLVNKHIIDYHPILLELTAKIHPLIFLWIPKGFFSPEYFIS